VRRIFSDFSHTCPKKIQKKVISKRKKALHVIIGAILAPLCARFQGHREGFQRFCPDCTGFCPDFKEFCPDVHQIKTFAGVLAPLHPASCTSDGKVLVLLIICDTHGTTDFLCFQ